MIISTMKNSFLRVFHLADYQAVTRITKQDLGKVCKTLIFCTLQVLAKNYEHAHRKYWLLGQNTYLYSGGHKKHPHGNTRYHPERSEGSPHWQRKAANTPAPVCARRTLPTLKSTVYNVILSAAKDLLACNTKPTSPPQSLRRGLYPTWQSFLLTNKP